jgi:hypothetical protein
LGEITVVRAPNPEQQRAIPVDDLPGVVARTHRLPLLIGARVTRPRLDGSTLGHASVAHVEASTGAVVREHEPPWLDLQ